MKVIITDKFAKQLIQLYFQYSYNKINDLGHLKFQVENNSIIIEGENAQIFVDTIVPSKISDPIKIWGGMGFGNIVSVYFQKVLFHFSEHYSKNNCFDFAKSIDNSHFKIKYKVFFKQTKEFYLQKYFPNTIDEILSVNKREFVIANEKRVKKGNRFCYFHQCEHGILDNLHIIRSISSYSIERYMNIHSISKFIFDKDDVVIHYRVGDILVNGHNCYPILHFSNYFEILKNKSNINNIYIVWKSERKCDNTNPQRNIAVINSLEKYLKDTLTIKGNVIKDIDYDDDFIFLLTSPYLITGISTYSLWAALMGNGKAIIPQCKLHFDNRIFSDERIQFQKFLDIGYKFPKSDELLIKLLNKPIV